MAHNAGSCALGILAEVSQDSSWPRSQFGREVPLFLAGGSPEIAAVSEFWRQPAAPLVSPDQLGASLPTIIGPESLRAPGRLPWALSIVPLHLVPPWFECAIYVLSGPQVIQKPESKDPEQIPSSFFPGRCFWSDSGLIRNRQRKNQKA